MTTVVISQPMYLPWAGFLDLILRADVLVWLDDVMFSKGSFTNRVQMRHPQGKSWMSLPLVGKGRGCQIRSLRIADTDWRASHRALIAHCVAHRPGEAATMALFDATAQVAVPCEMLIAGAEALARRAGELTPDIRRSSAMDVPGRGSARVRDLVIACGGTRYLTGQGARFYLDHEDFEAAGIGVYYMDYDFRPWAQAGGDQFDPFVSGLDLLAACPQDMPEHLCGRPVPWREFTIRER